MSEVLLWVLILINTHYDQGLYKGVKSCEKSGAHFTLCISSSNWMLVDINLSLEWERNTWKATSSPRCIKAKMVGLWLFGGRGRNASDDASKNVHFATQFSCIQDHYFRPAFCCSCLPCHTRVLLCGKHFDNPRGESPAPKSWLITPFGLFFWTF